MQYTILIKERLQNTEKGTEIIDLTAGWIISGREKCAGTNLKMDQILSQGESSVFLELSWSCL
jgi:hypothetical protein